jgi:hypothetical protein
MSPYSGTRPPQVESKAQVAKRRREAQQEFLYTIPVAPQVGLGSSGSRACSAVCFLGISVLSRASNALMEAPSWC